MKTFFQVKMAKMALEDKAAKADSVVALVRTQKWFFPILNNYEGMQTINIKKNNSNNNDK